MTTDFQVRICGRGLHEIREGNVYVVHRKNGLTERRCRACHLLRQRKADAKRRAANN